MAFPMVLVSHSNWTLVGKIDPQTIGSAVPERLPADVPLISTQIVRDRPHLTPGLPLGSPLAQNLCLNDDRPAFAKNRGGGG